jgi:hypothetical protein
MNYRKLSFAVIFVLFAVLLLPSQGKVIVRDADGAPPILAAAQTAKQQCINACRARYHDCRSLKQISSSECRSVYQDCTRFQCSAVRG